MREVLVWLLAMRGRLALVVAGMSVIGLAVPVASGLCAFCCLAKTPRQATETAVLGAALFGALQWIGGGPIWTVTATLFLLLMLVVALATTIRRFNSLNLALQLISVLALLSVLVWALVLPGVPTALQAYVDSYVLLLEQAQMPVDHDALEVLLAFAPVFLVGSAYLALLISVVLGRYWQSLMSAPGGFGEEFRGFRLGLIAGVPATFGLVAGLILRWPSLINLALLCGLIFCVQGLAVAHAMAKTWNIGKAPLVVMYVMLVPVGQIVVPLIATVGLVDNWFDLRKRIEPKK